ncbi:MAG: ParB family transcriptional regulator, chromosome partitioning protein [Actinomycetota bacterium]|nr:ParB family transcriptional regulator, chromosome partitioning protein [Actinomycetota bacterium]
MSEKRRGLGRGLGALIPTSVPATTTDGERPPDIFLPGRERAPLAPLSSAAQLTAGVLPHESALREEYRPGLPMPSPAQDGLPGQGRTTFASRPDDDGTELLPVPGACFAEIPVTQIVPNPRQPRQVFDEDAMAELAHSVREIGVLQPVVVRRVEDNEEGPSFELIMGERRWRASQDAGLERIPAIIRDTSDDVLLRDALLENLHRAQLNPLEEAAAYQQLLDDFGCTHEELATRIGRSRPQISNTIRLLRLPPGVQRRVAATVLSAGHARALLGLDDPAGMERLAQRIVAEGLSVRAVEEIVALGEPGRPASAKRRPRAGAHTSELDELASRLGDRLETRVSVSLGRNRGRLNIDFASVEDLNRIIELLSPEVRKAFQAE